MKFISRSFVIVLSFAACVAIRAGSFPPSGDNAVIGLKGALSGSFNLSPTLIISSSLTSGQIINIARGRANSASVPTNEVLALVINCNSGASALTVYDTAARTNLVILAFPVDGIPVATATKAIVALDLAVQNVGNGTWGFTDGFLTMVASASLDTNGCPTKASTAVSGGVDLNFNGFPTPVAITKGKLSGNRIDTLV